MSTSDGLQRLTEYLNQTRRQAELAIDTLNKRLLELEATNHEMVAQTDRLRTERDYFLGLCEQLKVENSTKWRLQERDDWKALVESVQSDRARLQDHCSNLEQQIELTNIEIDRLNKELEIASGRVILGFGTPSFSRSRGNTPSPTDETTPRTMSRQLKVELEKATAQMEVDRRSALNEKLAQEEEINRLREQLERLSKNQKIDIFPNGIPGTGGSSAVINKITKKKGVWGSSVVGLLYLVWNGVDDTRTPSKPRIKSSDVIVV